MALSIEDLNNIEKIMQQNVGLRKQNESLQKKFMDILILCDEPADNMAVVEFQERIKNEIEA